MEEDKLTEGLTDAQKVKFGKLKNWFGGVVDIKIDALKESLAKGQIKIRGVKRKRRPKKAVVEKPKEGDKVKKEEKPKEGDTGFGDFLDKLF